MCDSPSDLNGSFHIFRMEWTPSLISTYVDNNWTWSIDITPGSCTDCSEFHQPHFIILNLAVTIHDENGAPVEGASVSGTFTGSHNETVAATTSASGVANLVTSVRNRNASFQICIDDVVKSGVTYDFAANVETCDTY